ncbi:hypothetical protein NUU61_009370 [Penicillium alfredii]|uniref:Uncharacterized protein n=1 Tax=Penicillium alfredii TaxID=1506179 RepID=A0A9W9EN85_9EURO|nr:uncharacterized protein NUU61_009370 [Penicillium alfredii]KAJ5084791.1 hypothetical protein NUU61_009370 [Penicillium alfredii]
MSNQTSLTLDAQDDPWTANPSSMYLDLDEDIIASIMNDVPHATLEAEEFSWWQIEPLGMSTGIPEPHKDWVGCSQVTDNCQNVNPNPSPSTNSDDHLELNPIQLNPLDGVARVMKDFTAIMERVSAQLETFTTKIEKLNGQVDDMQKKVDSTASEVEALDDILSEVLKREQMAMEKFGDIASRFDG